MIFWVLPNYGFKTVSSLNGLLSEFAAGHPDVPVEISVKTQTSLWKQLFFCLHQPKDFQLPDLVQIPHHWTTIFSRLGLFQDLLDWDPQLVLDGWMEGLRPHCLLAGTNRIYSLPWWAELSVLHYRSDHLKEVTSRPQKLLGTWDGLLDACGAIQKKRGGSGFHPLENNDARGAISMKDVLPCIWNRQGELLTGDMGRSVIHNDETVRGIEDYLLLAKRGYLPLMKARPGRAPGVNSLSEGGASMAFSRRFAENPVIKTVPFPGMNSQPGPEKRVRQSSFLVGHNLAVLHNSRNSRDAFALLKWLTRSDVQTRYAGTIRAFSPASDRALSRGSVATKGSLEAAANSPGMGTSSRPSPKAEGSRPSRDIWKPQSFAESKGTPFASSNVLYRQFYQEILPNARTLPNITVCGTYEQLIDEVLWKTAKEILRQSYTADSLGEKLIMVQAETDYLLSLYGDR